MWKSLLASLLLATAALAQMDPQLKRQRTFDAITHTRRYHKGQSTLYARDVILGRIKLPSKEEMAKDDAAWVKREEALKDALEKIDFQADYVRELCAATER